MAKYLLKIKRSDTSWQHHDCVFLSILHPLANLQCVFFVFLSIQLLKRTLRMITPQVSINEITKITESPEVELNRSYPTKE